jgi:hypothetical protein
MMVVGRSHAIKYSGLRSLGGDELERVELDIALSFRAVPARIGVTRADAAAAKFEIV